MQEETVIKTLKNDLNFTDELILEDANAIRKIFHVPKQLLRLIKDQFPLLTQLETTATALTQTYAQPLF